MTSLHNIMVAACVLASGAAFAETYDGVHPLTTERARADVAQEAVIAAASPNPYAEGALSGVVAVMVTSLEREEVQREAVAAAHAPNQNVSAMAFYNSVIPEQMNGSAVNGYFANDSKGTLSAEQSF